MNAAEISAMASAFSAGFAALTAALSLRQIKLSDRATQAAVFIEISREWNRIYPKYRALLVQEFDPVKIQANYPRFDNYATTDEWRQMHRVFAFFEFVGACARSGMIEEHKIFHFVAINPKLWEKYAPLIKYYREESQRHDLYVAWEYLHFRRLLYLPGLEHERLGWIQAWLPKLGRVL